MRNISRSRIQSSPRQGDIRKDEEHEQAQDERDDERDEKADEAADDLAQDEPVARDPVGQGQLQRPPLLLADDRVVGEQDGEEAENDLDDEGQVERPEDREHGIAFVFRIDQVGIIGDVDRRDAADRFARRRWRSRRGPEALY